MFSISDLQEQPMQVILQILINHWKIIGIVFLLIVLKAFFSSPKVKGWWGELQVTRFGLNKLDPNCYQVFNDIYLPRPDGKGTTQIDHLVVSRCGLFVIETKNYSGWIFGSEKQRQWTQQIYKTKNRFQNPIHQNQLHINALADFLGIKKSLCHNIVFFIGDCTLKTELPDFVLTKGLLRFIKTKSDTIVDDGTLESISSQLTSYLSLQDKKTVAKEHVRSLEARKSN